MVFLIWLGEKSLFGCQNLRVELHDIPVHILELYVTMLFSLLFFFCFFSGLIKSVQGMQYFFRRRSERSLLVSSMIGGPDSFFISLKESISMLNCFLQSFSNLVPVDPMILCIAIAFPIIRSLISFQESMRSSSMTSAVSLWGINDLVLRQN